MSPEETKAKDIEDALKKHDAEVKAADAKKRADADQTDDKLEKILTYLDSLGKRMDAYDEKSKGEGEIEEKGDPRPLGADAQVVRADSAADVEEIESYRRELGATHKIAASSVLAQIQTDADRAATAWGRDAVHPWDGEPIVTYRRRTARLHQQHSPAWREVDLGTIEGRALRNACSQIFADSIKASESSESYGETLREVVRHDPVSGQRRIEFYGSPSAWTNQFKSGGMRVTKFKTGSGWKQQD